MNYLHSIIILFFFVITLNAQTVVPGGNVSGTWTLANSPYYVTGAITIPNGETLTIQPGVTVSFQGNYMFQVLGRIIAIGTATDTITFTAADAVTGWHGLRFINTPSTNDTSKFIYCKIENGNAPTGTGDTRYGSGIFIRGFSKVVVSHCLFQNNRAAWGGAISVRDYASILIEHSTFKNNYSLYSGAALRFHDYSDATVRFNHIHNNNSDGGGTAIYAYRSNPFVYNNYIHDNIAVTNGAAGNFENANPVFMNNLMVNNTAQAGGALYFAALCYSAKFINNTIVNNVATANGGAIYCNLSSTPDFTNNIIWENTAAFGTQVYINNDNSDPNFYNCIVQYGTIGFYGNGSQGNYQGVYSNNIESNPLLVQSGQHPYSIPENSPAVDAGKIDTAGLNLLPFDYALNPRIDNGRIDIGAYEYQSVIPVELIAFTAAVHNSQVILNWSTATEMNNYGFEIERSETYETGNERWIKVGFAEGNGNSTSIKEYSFTENLSLNLNLSPNHTLIYRLKQIDYNGSFSYSPEIKVELGNMPTEFALYQNYPNPFNPVTTIKFALPVDGKVLLEIYNIIGEKVATLIDKEMNAGYHRYEFNAANLTSGVFIYKLTSGNFTKSYKMMLLK